MDRAEELYIGQLELLAAVVAYTTFPDPLAGQHVIRWMDNDSAVYSLVKGYCGAADSARVVNIFHSAMCRLGVTPWMEYVSTEDNIADLPSWGEFGVLYTLGGADSYRKAILPRQAPHLLECSNRLAVFGPPSPAANRNFTES